jgi:rRNA maturation endonuclease Nob1
MDLVNNIGKKVTETAKALTKKSEDIVEITKLNLTIGNEEEKMKRLLFEIGSELYRSYTNGNVQGEELYDRKFSEIAEIENNIKALKEKILLLKGNKTCNNCSSVIGLEVNYCPNCGSKLEKEEE